MLEIVAKIAIQILAGLGLAKVADIVKPNIPDPYKPDTGIIFTPVKIAWIVGIFTVGVMLIKFIGKKLNVKLLK
jgi:hypothetical protein